MQTAEVYAASTCSFVGLLVVLIVAQCGNAAPERQQRRVDVVRLLHPLSIALLFAAFRSSQVTHGQPADPSSVT